MSHDELSRAIGNIEGKLDSVLEQLKRKDERLDNHANRLAKLERWQAWTLGAGAAAGAALAAVWAVFTQLFHGR
jgi:hypothetical protein